MLFRSPLANKKNITLRDLAEHPIISYTHSFDEGSELARAFKDAGVKPNVVFTAEDPDVIKTYVRKGMGVGIVACMAYDQTRDAGIVAFNASGIFPGSTTWVGFRKDRFLRDYMYSFVELVAPEVSRERIDEAIERANDPNAPDAPLAESLAPVNTHPGLGQPFSTCCNGGFNL